MDMDFTMITQFIGSFGFPIAACCALYWSNAKEAERHQAEMDRITEALQQNTIALTKIETLLSRDQ